MAKKKADTSAFVIPAVALTESEAPEDVCDCCGDTPVRHAPKAAAPLPPLSPVPMFPTYANWPGDASTTLQVLLVGGGPMDGAYRLPSAPIPLELSYGRTIYNLSDRDMGIYAYRVP